MSTEARRALIDPLVEPDPSDETGLNSRFRSTYAPRTNSSLSKHHDFGLPKQGISKHDTGSSTLSSNNPFRNRSSSGSHSNSKEPIVSTRSRGPSTSSNGKYPTPPQSASPRKAHFDTTYREKAFEAYSDEPRRRSSSNQRGSPKYSGMDSKDFGRARSRGSSLGGRYPGDQSHRPLDIITKDSKKAHRSPHLKKKHIPGADSIDKLDNSPIPGLGNYHHEGPYDAALLARNTSYESSPIAAVQSTNAEALKATPKENIEDSLVRHRPLEGVAIIPPGIPDRFGRVYNYEEGADLMRENGANYKRWPGVEYHPDDLKGKGEPSFSIDRALKQHKFHGEPQEQYTNGIEMKTRRRNKSHSHVDETPVTDSSSGANAGYVEWESDMRRSNSTGGKRLSDGLKKRISSLRKKGQAT